MMELTEYAAVEIDRFVDSFMASAECGKKVGSVSPFWEKSEKAFLTALIYYILENDGIPVHEKNLTTLLRLVHMAEVPDDDEESPLIMEIEAWLKNLGAEKSLCKAKLYYDTFLIAPQYIQTIIFCTIEEDLERYISSGAFYTAKANGISWATESDFIRKLSESREFTKRQSVFSAGISW